MKKIGITGGIGSGKSIICRVFEKLEVPVFYADIESARLVNTDSDIIQSIKEIFGPDIYNKYNHLDRKKLRDIVFQDKEKLEKLNAIVHPGLRKHFAGWCENHADCPY